MSWSPDSWQSKQAAQLPVYPDAEQLAAAVRQLAALPPLVTSWEVEALKSKLAACARGEMFLLQGGDCAESFDDCRAEHIAAKLKILLQMSLVMVHGTRKQVVRVGRIAGQYAKPRSLDLEERDGQALPSYRGDLVNRNGFTSGDRTPDPLLLVRGYERAALTINFIRALTEGGFADLHHPEYWDLEFVADEKLRRDYEAIVHSIRESLEFMEAVLEAQVSRTQRAMVYTSHEGLSLHYEAAQTRTVPRREGWYNLSTHLPWIGMRTAQADGAHVEFFRGIRNPIAVKVGPMMTPAHLRELIDILHPDDEPGRLTLIHRFGAERVRQHLPALVSAALASGRSVLWVCDPMHGNTETLASGLKTRRFERILEELRESFEVHESLGSVLGGVHFEMTGDDVTECIGGARGLGEVDLARAYRSSVDPRLNYEQALEMAMRIARQLRGGGW